MPVTFEQVFAAVQKRVGASSLPHLAPDELTRLIYEEMRRLDREAAERCGKGECVSFP